MGVDYGAKRIGLAVTDPLKIIANPLDTVRKIDLFDFLKEYFEKEEVEAIVVGEPTQKDGTASPIESEIKGFIRNFKKQYPDKQVFREDERYTSVMAQDAILQAGVKKKGRRDKALVDRVSASLILCSFLQRNA